LAVDATGSHCARKIGPFDAGKGNQQPNKNSRLYRGRPKERFYSGKLASARYFLSSVVSLAPAKAQAIKTADQAALEISENGF
jgi:hypothetical protein